MTTESVASLPLAGRSYDLLLGLMPGVAVNPGGLTPASRLGGGGDSNFMLDGATSMDPGRQPAGHARQRRGDSGSQRGDVDLPGGVRPRQRPAGQRGDQERHEPVPAAPIYDVERSSKWNANSRPTCSTAIRSRSRTSATGASRSAARSANPAAQTNCSSSSRRNSSPRTVGGDVTRTACPRCWSARVIFRSRRTTGQPYPYIRIRSKTGAVQRDQPGCLLR